MISKEIKRLILGAEVGIETNLGEISSALGVDEKDPLDQAVEIQRFMDECSLTLSPELRRAMGDFNLPRVLRSADDTALARFVEIDELESSTVERKSSLFFDRNKSLNKPGLPDADYYSLSVAHAALKTIAGFINSEAGGVLLLGVADDGAVVGIDCDFPFTPKKDVDSWQLRLQELIKASFKDGLTVLSYCRIDVISSNDVYVARVSVIPRRDLSFLKRPKDGGKYALYLRQGNQTNEIGIEHVPDLVAHRVILGGR